MAIIRYKVIVAEADGVELDYHEERSLDASNVYYNDINGDFDNLQDKVNDLDNLVATLVVPIVLSYNGTVQDGAYLGYTENIDGLNTPVVIPTTSKFTGFTFSNRNASSTRTLDFYKNTNPNADPAATPFYTASLNMQFEAMTLPTPENFNEGDEIYIVYNKGTGNTQDAVIVMEFRG
jgi:hypothetical protein